MEKINLNARKYRKSTYIFCAVFLFFTTYFAAIILTLTTPESKRINPTLGFLILYLGTMSIIGIFDIYLTYLGERNIWITKDVDKFTIHYMYDANKIEVKQGEELILHLFTYANYYSPYLHFKNKQTNKELKCKFYMSLASNQIYGEVVQLFKENNFEVTAFIGESINRDDYKIKYNYSQEVSETDNI